MEYLIRVNYKSGIQEEFWVKEFTFNGDVVTWETSDGAHRPIRLGVDNIESVWQIKVRGKRNYGNSS